MTHTHLRAPMVRLSLPLAVLFAVSACTPPDVVTPAPDKVQVKAFTASASEVAPGSPVTLSWDTEGATGVSLRTLDGSPVQGVEEKTLRGSVEVRPEKATTYVLTARGEGGSDSLMLTVRTPGSGEGATLLAMPPSIPAGQSSTLMWNVPGATGVQVKDAAGQVVAEGSAQGSVAVHPRLTTTYTVHASSRAGEATVEVEPGIVSFQADKKAYDPGETVTLSWTTGGGTSVTVLAEGRSEALAVVQGTEDVFTGTATDVVADSAPADGVQRYLLRLQAGEVTVERTLEVYTGALPMVEHFEPAPYVRAEAPYTVSWTTLKAQRVQVLVGNAPNYTLAYETQRIEEAREGQVELPALPARADVVLRAINAAGAVDAVRNVTPLRIPDVLDFSVVTGGSDSTVVAKGGDPVELRWNVKDARHMRLSIQGGKLLAEVTGEEAEQGSVKHFPNGPTTYVLEADNTLLNDGQLEAMVPATRSLTVTSPARFTYDPDPVAPGGVVNVTGTTIPGSTTFSGIPGVLKNLATEQFINIQETGTPVPVTTSSERDDGTLKITLPREFVMRLHGAQVGGNILSITPNGDMVLVDDSYFYTSDPFYIAPLKHDLQFASTTTVGYYYQLDTVEGEDRLIVQWAPIHDYPAADTPNEIAEFQVQLYASGKVVFAYKQLSVPTSIGKPYLNDASGKTPWPLDRDSLKAGDTLTFFPVLTPPFSYPQGAPFLTATVAIPGGSIDIQDSPNLLPYGGLSITEVMFNAPLGAEWFELRNTTSAPFVLTGAVLEFKPGTNVTLPLPEGFTLQPGQSFVFAQTSDLGGEPVQADFTYGPDIILDNTTGSISLKLHGVDYARAEWTNATVESGQAMRFDAHGEDRIYDPGSLMSFSCPATQTFGTLSRKGTPGQADRDCFPYRMEQLATGAFQSIGATGTRLVFAPGFESEALDDGFASLPAGLSLKVDGQTYTTATISTNGVITLGTWVDDGYAQSTNRRDFAPNAKGIYQTIAPFWDDLLLTEEEGSGVYYLRDDTAGVTTISWEKVTFWDLQGAVLNFQVKFFDTGDIEFHYGDMQTKPGTTGDFRHRGSSATVWLERPAGGVASRLVTGNSNTENPLRGIDAHTGLRFRYQP